MGQSSAAPEKPISTLTPQETLRRDCLLWAFQTREISQVPWMDVVSVARSYYDFITGQSGRYQIETAPQRNSPAGQTIKGTPLAESDAALEGAR